MKTLKNIRQDRGAVLMLALFVLFALGLLAVTAIRQSIDDMSATANLTRRTQALLAAEAGLARADYIMGQNGSLTAADSLLKLINSDTLLPNAHFRAAMNTDLPLRKVVVVGTSREGSAAVQVLYRHGKNPANIWDNAIFAGHGQDGVSIRGNVGIHGSVHILGDGEPFNDVNGDGVRNAGEPYTDSNHDGAYDPPLGPGNPALDMTGTATISNNYAGMPAALTTRVPPLLTTPYGGEQVSTLFSELRVKHGNVVLDGNAKVGQPNAPGGSPQWKETLDGVYVSDGFTGSAASSGVYSDNGYGLKYDMEDVPLVMPSLDDPYTDPSTGSSYSTYMEYLRNNALVINGDLTLNAGVATALQADGKGSIAMDAAGNLQISGIVYVEGNIRILGSSPILYDGRATLVSEKSITIDNDFLSKGGFPADDIVGAIAYKTIVIGGLHAQLDLTGAFFAQEEVINAKQTQLAGAIVSNSFGMTQVPDIYQVPDLLGNLPPAMPGADDVVRFTWRRVPRSWAELP